MLGRRKPFFSIDTGFRPIEKFGGLIHQSVMPLVSLSKGGVNALGSAFVVHPGGILVTAKHVIQGALPDSKFREQIYALYVSNRKHKDGSGNHIGGLIPVTKEAWSLELDIAYCLLQPMVNKDTGKQLLFPSFSVTAKPPRVGENILAIGYYNNHFDEIRHENGQIKVSNSREGVSTTGIVIEVFLNKRDSGMLSFPCFQSSSQYEPGMSGGPIFGEAGYVCGVVCSGLRENSSSNEFVTYGSILGPSFAYNLKGWFADKNPAHDVLVSDLINEGAIRSEAKLATGLSSHKQ